MITLMGSMKIGFQIRVRLESSVQEDICED